MPERRYPDGHTVHTRDGAGPGIVLLNGCALAAVGWDEVIAALPGRRIIAVDRPGRRGTSCTALPTLAGETRFLADLLRDTEPGPVIVVAHSMAAFQAEALARTRPGLVAGVVLVDPAITAGARVGGRIGAELAWRAADLLLGHGPVRRPVARIWRRGLKSQTVRPELIDTSRWRETWASRRSLAAGTAEWMAFPAQAAELERLREAQKTPAPVGAVIVEAPPPVPLVEAAVLHSSFAATRLRRLPGCRHLTMVDAPLQVAEEICLVAEGHAARAPGAV
ncbi:MAG: alpha/beta hydrolase [Actinomyces sp.]|uniref:alpha/beta fold hydrolase n=1 Tax=Actinomyces sp. TaxID=29317 RepID=UPI0026DACD88|nr:alpha/beta hydrolase [Actinomyces sp.]MDO4243395.1 alpha/beta hydrolase [Actinomyces sp.]